MRERFLNHLNYLTKYIPRKQTKVLVLGLLGFLVYIWAWSHSFFSIVSALVPETSTQHSQLLQSLFTTIGESASVEVFYPNELDLYVNSHPQQLEGQEILSHFDFDLDDDEVLSDVV